MHARLYPPSVAPHEWETLSDAEQVFTLMMPRGWRNRAWLQNNGSIPHQLATAQSPTGITEERTVIDSQGNTYQVADGYDRYFRRRSDGAWIGTRDHRGLSDIPGVNPDDYEEVKIKLK